MEHALRKRRRLWTRLETAGLSETQERRFRFAAGLFLALYAGAWVYTIATVGADGALPLTSGSAALANPLSTGGARPASYVFDAAARQLAKPGSFRGISGAVNIVVTAPGEPMVVPDSLPAGAAVAYTPAEAPAEAAAVRDRPATPGIWRLVLQLGDVSRSIPGVNLITLVPLSEKRGNYIGSYLVGSWPNERGGKPRSPAYAPPRGLIKVTPENMGVYVSKHVRLGDFLTKGQKDVWPKYVAMSPRELDKIELTLQELEREGHPVTHLGVISAFRTPLYNSEGGNTAGRASMSRHMYGDAMDIYIDNDRDGRMDDLNGDGRVDVKDARVLARAADRVEQRYPEMIGGIGVYAPTGAHAGFVHIDTRGYRARW